MFPNGGMHASLQFLFQAPQLSLLPLAHRLSQDREVSLPGPSADVREPQEVERFRLAFPTLTPILFRKAAKFDDSCLIGMQLQAEVRTSFAQLRQELLCFLPMLESCHKVISKPREDDLSACVPPSPLPDPEIECVVKIDIRQQRANTPALNCPYLTLHPFALFQHAGLEPFLDQAHNAPIGYAVLDKLHQPSVIESVIKRKILVRNVCRRVRQDSPGKVERRELMLCVATMGMHLAWRERAKNFSSPLGIQ